MIIKKGTILKIKHSRKGTFEAAATKDFDTEKNKWYPIEARETVRGINYDWRAGSPIPCRACLCEIAVIVPGTPLT